ncbi:hypothetical protein EI555_015689, partial [Monodon monoceros]
VQTREIRIEVAYVVVVSEGRQGERISHVGFDKKGDQHRESPSGHWSLQAVLVDRTIYISGQLGMDPASGQLVPGGVAEEAKQALTNMGEILKAAGCDFTNVVKTTVLLADINDFNTVNDIYKQ